MLDYQNPPYLEADMPPAMAEDGKGDIVCSLLAHIISIYQRTRTHSQVSTSSSLSSKSVLTAPMVLVLETMISNHKPLYSMFAYYFKLRRYAKGGSAAGCGGPCPAYPYPRSTPWWITSARWVGFNTMGPPAPWFQNLPI